MRNNIDTGIYIPPFSIVHILCQPYAQLHQKLAVAQLFNMQKKWSISHLPPVTPSALLVTHRIKRARLSFRKGNASKSTSTLVLIQGPAEHLIYSPARYSASNSHKQQHLLVFPPYPPWVVFGCILISLMSDSLSVFTNYVYLSLFHVSVTSFILLPISF